MKNDGLVKKYIKKKYGFVPTIISSEAQVHVHSIALLGYREKTGKYIYKLSDTDGKEFRLFYYSDTKKCKDDYMEEKYTEEVRKMFSDILNIEFYDFHIRYSYDGNLLDENYASVEELLENCYIEVWGTTYDDFKIDNLAFAEKYEMHFEIAKLSQDYFKACKIKLNSMGNFENKLIIDYRVIKLYDDNECKIFKNKRIPLAENIVYVNDERYPDDSFKITEIEEDVSFDIPNKKYEIISPVYKICRSVKGAGHLFFMGKYYDEYEQNKTVVLRKEIINNEESKTVICDVTPYFPIGSIEYYHLFGEGNYIIALAKEI